MIAIKNITEETCGQCGAEPTLERSDTYVGILHEERRFACGRVVYWQERGALDERTETPCPQSPEGIATKRSHVQTIKALLETLTHCPVTAEERKGLAGRIKAEFWRDVKEEDLR